MMKKMTKCYLNVSHMIRFVLVNAINNTSEMFDKGICKKKKNRKRDQQTYPINKRYLDIVNYYSPLALTLNEYCFSLY